VRHHLDYFCPAVCVLALFCVFQPAVARAEVYIWGRPVNAAGIRPGMIVSKCNTIRKNLYKCVNQNPRNYAGLKYPQRLSARVQDSDNQGVRQKVFCPQGNPAVKCCLPGPRGGFSAAPPSNRGPGVLLKTLLNKPPDIKLKEKTRRVLAKAVKNRTGR